MIDTGHLDHVIDMLDRVHQAGRIRVAVDITIKQADLRDATILGQSLQLLVGQVAVVFANGHR